MILSMRKALLLAIIAFLLLLSLLSWTIVNPYHNINTQYQAPSHRAAFTCPPPPFEC